MESVDNTIPYSIYIPKDHLDRCPRLVSFYSRSLMLQHTLKGRDHILFILKKSATLFCPLSILFFRTSLWPRRLLLKRFSLLFALCCGQVTPGHRVKPKAAQVRTYRDKAWDCMMEVYSSASSWLTPTASPLAALWLVQTDCAMCWRITKHKQKQGHHVHRYVVI